MTRELGLLAIEYPAPSIPARFRLYHGGQAKRGYLVTHDPESGGYLGDYVYFSSVRSYAQKYVRRSKNAARALFVVDARYIPAGARVMMSDQNGWPSRSVEELLFALIDMTNDLKDLQATLEKSSARSLLDAVHPLDAEIASRIQWIRYLRHASENAADGPALSPKLHRLLEKALVRFLGPALAATKAQLAPSDDYPAKDRWNNVLLFLLDTFGTLDLTLAQLRSALTAYREQWQQAFTLPLSHANLEAVRELGVQSLRAAGYFGGARSGMIITVHGPIPVLSSRKTAGRRPKTGKRARA